MERIEDFVCCAEDEAAMEKKENRQCVCLHEEFSRVCLDRAVLDVALTDFFGSRCEPDNLANRYAFMPPVRIYVVGATNGKTQLAVFQKCNLFYYSCTFFVCLTVLIDMQCIVSTHGGSMGAGLGNSSVNKYQPVLYMKSWTPTLSVGQRITMAFSTHYYRIYRNRHGLGSKY